MNLSNENFEVRKIIPTSFNSDLADVQQTSLLSKKKRSDFEGKYYFHFIHSKAGNLVHRLRGDEESCIKCTQCEVYIFESDDVFAAARDTID